MSSIFSSVMADCVLGLDGKETAARIAGLVGRISEPRTRSVLCNHCSHRRAE